MGGCPLRSNVSPGTDTQVAIVRPRLLNPPQAKLAPVHAIGDALRRYQGRSEHWTCRVGGPAAAMHLAVPLALPANVACLAGFAAQRQDLALATTSVEPGSLRERSNPWRSASGGDEGPVDLLVGAELLELTDELVGSPAVRLDRHARQRQATGHCRRHGKSAVPVVELFAERKQPSRDCQSLPSQDGLDTTFGVAEGPRQVAGRTA